MPNLRGKTWTTTTPANVEDAQYWEDHLISDADAAKIGTVILPAGGTAGQVLTKQSSTANDATWEEPASSGHTIIDENGDDMPYRTNLQFTNAEVTDDSVNDITIVDCKGEKGDPGQAATITVGTVTTLPAGSNATVTNSGTSSAAVFDFGIPKGADGSGAGDMLKADYDPNSVVELAGGIPDYVASQAYTLPTAASNVLGGVKVGTNLSIDASGVLSATDTNTDALHDLTDVNISLPSDGQALLYDSANNKWVNGDVAGSASDITYDNTGSGLTATDVQEAIDEIDSNLDTLDGKVYKTDDSTETTIASDDLLPIYDTSAMASKKITVADVISGTVSNPNLFVNAWFTVNQRGLSSYTTEGGHSADRWKINANTGNLGSVDIDNGIVIDNTSGSGSFDLIQTNRYDECPFENILGKEATLSILLSNGDILSNSATIPAVPTSWSDIITINIPNTGQFSLLANDNRVIGSIGVYAGKTLSVRAVKFEPGPISTLHLDTAPNYATELLKCQRYFQNMNILNLKYSSVGTGKTIGTTALYVDIPLCAPMRTTPTLSMSGNIRCHGNGSVVAQSTYTPSTEQLFSNIVKISLKSLGTALTDHSVYMIDFADTVGVLQLSADL